MKKTSIMLLAALTLGGATVANAATTPSTPAKTQAAKPKHVAPVAKHIAAKPQKPAKQPG